MQVWLARRKEKAQVFSKNLFYKRDAMPPHFNQISWLALSQLLGEDAAV
jgi:hypothetical protein